MVPMASAIRVFVLKTTSSGNASKHDSWMKRTISAVTPIAFSVQNPTLIAEADRNRAREKRNGLAGRSARTLLLLLPFLETLKEAFSLFNVLLCALVGRVILQHQTPLGDRRLKFFVAIKANPLIVVLLNQTCPDGSQQRREILVFGRELCQLV